MENHLTVIVPFYNEESHLYESINRLLKVNIAKNIILVDDCSTDESLNIAKKISERHKNINLISKKKNEGKGSSVRYAKNLVNTSHVIVHDADLEYNPLDIELLFEKSKIFTNDLIIGSRTMDLKLIKNRNVFLGFVNNIFTLLFNKLNNQKISDIASCYILMPSKFFKSEINNENGFGIEIEILSKAVLNDMKIIEIPIHYSGRSYKDGKKIKLLDGLNIAFKIFKYSSFFNRKKF